MIFMRSRSLLGYARKIAQEAKNASSQIANLSSKFKNTVLNHIAKEFRVQRQLLINGNTKDLAFARKTGLSNALIDRISLDEKRIEGMARSVEAVAKLRDPIGQITDQWRRPNGLRY